MSARLPTEEEAIAYCESISDLYGSRFANSILVLCKAARRERRLTKIIEEAPHDDRFPCGDFGYDESARPCCTCWKRAALADEETR